MWIKAIYFGDERVRSYEGEAKRSESGGYIFRSDKGDVIRCDGMELTFINTNAIY